MRFPPSFIERLRDQILVSEVVGKRIVIKKHGREYHACCPFHNEKTPSFTVNDEKGFYHCFGCGAHGDVIEFVRRHDKLTYPETIERLARDAGIALPELSREDTKKTERDKTLHDVLEAACVWFEQQLASTQGATARDYLERRGLQAHTMRQYRAGLAPDDRTALYKHLLKAGFSEALQAEAGLISISEQGTVYDRFRGRIIFPIRSSRGNIIAFGGRLFAKDTQKNLPKYLNSPETPLFKKGEMLFNFDLAKQPARNTNMVVVMEGYMDVISCAQAGIDYAVATLGTAVTPEHLKLLWQVAKEPIICLDGDAAGKRAMLRALDICLPLLAPGFSLRFAMLPAGEDPDSYVTRHGKAGFEKILASSRRLSQVIWETLSPQYRLDLPEGRAALEDACKQLCDKITNQTVRQHYLSYFRKQLWERSSPSTKTSAASGRSLHIDRVVAQDQSSVRDTLVHTMFQLLIKYPSLLNAGQREDSVAHLEIRDIRLQAVRNTMLSALAHGLADNRESFLAQLRTELPEEVLAPLLKEPLKLPYRDDLAEETAGQLWDETLKAYNIARLEHELEELQHAMAKTMDEVALERMVQLQHAIKKAQSGRTFAPAEAENL